MTSTDFRRLALALPGAEESSHMGSPDFRVGGRIFATLAAEAQGYGNLMLTPEQQAAFVAEAPELFLPVSGGWGRMGITHIRLAAATEPALAGALHTAWNLRIQKNGGARKRKPAAKPKKNMTRISIALLAILSMCHPASAQTPNQTLSSLVDKNRVLLVFAPTDQDPRLNEQLNLLSHHSQDMKERDLILIPVPAQPGPPTTPETLRALRPPLVSASEQLTLRHRFHIAPPDFAAILLGKDGGEKLRSSTPISIERLNRTIDAMPMRQQEMRQRTPKP